MYLRPSYPSFPSRAGAAGRGRRNILTLHTIGCYMKSWPTKAVILMKTEQNIINLAARIREFSQNPVNADPPDLAGLAEEFLRAVRGIDPGEATYAAPIAESGLNVYRIIQSTKDSQSIRACLRILLGIGRFGRILAARFVFGMAVPLRELAAIITSIPASDRLALAHEMMLASPGGPDRQMLSWLEGLMQPLAATDPAELAPFVASLGCDGEILAFPARQVIMNGLFGKWLETSLETGADAEELAQLCCLVRALDDPEQAMTLAVSMSVGFIKPTRQALETVALVAEAGDKRVLNLFLTTLKTGDRTLAGASLDGIIAQNTPNAGKLLATIRKKMPSLRRIASTRVPLLGDVAYQAYLSALSREEKEKARTEAFGVLLGIAPDFVEALTRAGTARPMAGPGDTAPQASAGETEPLSCHKPGFFARLFGSRKKTLGKPAAQIPQPARPGADLLQGGVHGDRRPRADRPEPGRVLLPRDRVHPQQDRGDQPAGVHLRQERGHGLHLQQRGLLGLGLRRHGLCQLLVQRLQFHGDRLCQLRVLGLPVPQLRHGRQRVPGRTDAPDGLHHHGPGRGQLPRGGGAGPAGSKTSTSRPPTSSPPGSRGWNSSTASSARPPWTEPGSTPWTCRGHRSPTAPCTTRTCPTPCSCPPSSASTPGWPPGWSNARRPTPQWSARRWPPRSWPPGPGSWPSCAASNACSNTTAPGSPGPCTAWSGPSRSTCASCPT